MRMVSGWNRLKDEKSPYLKEHAQNPVDWYPWCDEAFERARKEDKPLIISIGYSTCHWCHVMERESFKDKETARIMNTDFVSVKVDREERPDLDSLYMKTVQAMTGRGGWPLTVFTTHDGTPFFGGSYFPVEDSHGLPSFKKVLQAVSLLYKKDKGRIREIKEGLEKVFSPAIGQAGEERLRIDSGISRTAYEAADIFFDAANGGFGAGTKFPHAMFLRFLLEYHERTGEAGARLILKKTLDAMAAGGIYDHLGGGFHRYSVDAAWEVPHFEKMLYDNALLSSLYTRAFEASPLEQYKSIAMETLDYMLRDMRGGDGGFHSAEDADSEGREGAYYLWDYEEVKRITGPGSTRVMDYFSMTPEGNYEGENTLRINTAMKDPPGADEIRAFKNKLFDERIKRPRPAVDKKIITGWNGLAISALTGAARVFKETRFLEEARRCARFILDSSFDKSGRLLRYYLDGAAMAKAGLEDYAMFGGGLLSIHGLTGEAQWLKKAQELAEEMVRLFYDAKDRVFYDTGVDQERLFLRERDPFDSDVPSGDSATADFLLRLSNAAGRGTYRELSEGILEKAVWMAREPLSSGNFLCVVEAILKGENK